MRVGLVSPYDLSEPGGVQGQVLGLALALAAAGDEPLVIGPRLPDGVPGVDLGRAVRIPGNGSMVPISLDPSVPATLRAATRDLEILHVHEPLMPIAALAANRSGPPVVATFHADPTRWVRRAYRRSGPLLRFALGNTKAVTAVSRTAASAVPDELDPVIVPNGVNVQVAPTGVTRRSARVAFLGRDEKRKGLDVLLQAWPTVVEAVPDAELVVMGAVRRTPGVEWLGRVDDRRKMKELAGATVYVAPNLGGESFGIVLVEAMTTGTPVIASDLEAFRDVGGDAARYFPPGDSGALAGNLVDLLFDRAAREELSQRGTKRALRFDWETVAAAYREIYLVAIG